MEHFTMEEPVGEVDFKVINFLPSASNYPLSRSSVRLCSRLKIEKIRMAQAPTPWLPGYEIMTMVERWAVVRED